MSDWLQKYLKILQDKPDMLEYSWRVELKRWILEDGLGYPPENIYYEKDRADIRIDDDSAIPYIIFETKIKDDDIYQNSTREKALSYKKGGESYIILANRKRWLVYDAKGEKRGDIIFTEKGILDGNLDPSGLFEVLHYKFIDERYKDFRAGTSLSGIIELNREGIEKLSEVLSKSHSMLYAYAQEVWPRICQRYDEYKNELTNLETARERVENIEINLIAKKEKLQAIDRQIAKLKKEYEVEIEAIERSYRLFLKVQPYSRDVKEEEALKIYHKEVCYLALNRALMIRILEDKELLNHKISRQGIKHWNDFTTFIKEEYQKLLRFSFWDAEKIYRHFFQEGVYDWFLKVDHKLGDVVLKVFYLLNAFNFAAVDRKALRELYQKYYDPSERKKLGEFYTPPEVINYLLDAVGWPSEGKLLDFACGSGGFLVEALRMKLEDMENRGLNAESQWRESEENLYGFDINPFATHITEMNLLFLLVDKFRQAMKEREMKGEDFTLPDLNIFNTDALLDLQHTNLQDVNVWPGQRWREAIEAREFTNYRFLVGNPPYIRNERLPEKEKKFYDEIFCDFKEGNTDIFAYFVKKGMDWLEEGGKMGLIVSQGLADAKAAEKIRRFLEEYTIEELVPLEWANVFKFASVNPFLIVVSKKKPPEKHKIKIRQNLRSLEELRQNRGRITEVNQNEWKDLAPDGSWRMEITAEDIPILNKLNKYPKPFEGHYGMVLRSKEILIKDSPAGMKNPVKILDGREVRAWCIDWQGRYLDYDKDKISDPKSEDFFNNTQIVIPNISLTTQAVVHNKDFYFRHTIMSVDCDLIKNPLIQCSLINSIINRYFSFKILRIGVLQGSRRCHFEPRVINNFIIPKQISKNDTIIDSLELLSQSCHSLAHEMVNGDRELSAWIEMKLREGTRFLSSYSDTNLSALSGALNIEDAYFDNDGRLVDGSLFHLGGDRSRLYYLLQRSALEGKAKLTKREIENFRMPENPAVLREVNLKIAEWLQRKPTLGEKLRNNEREIDRLVLEACSDLTDQERATILHRCSEFPLSEVIQTPLPGKPTKKIKVKVYTDRFK